MGWQETLRAKAEIERLRRWSRESEKYGFTMAAPRPATGKNLISFSLYGHHEKYRTGALRNAELAGTHFPAWTRRFYVGLEVGDEFRARLHDLGAETILMPHRLGGEPGLLPAHTGWRGPSPFGAFWRFLAAEDPHHDFAIIRESDTENGQLDGEDRDRVDAWIASGKAAHTFQHLPFFYPRPMLAGRWGVRCGTLPMSEMLSKWNFNGHYGDDEMFLAYFVWPLIQPSLLQHERGRRPTPSPVLRAAWAR